MSGREKSGDKMQQDAARRDKMRLSEETFSRRVDFEKVINKFNKFKLYFNISKKISPLVYKIRGY